MAARDAPDPHPRPPSKTMRIHHETNEKEARHGLAWQSDRLADDAVIQNGILGRGEITDVQLSGMTLQSGNGLVERKCTTHGERLHRHRADVHRDDRSARPGDRDPGSCPPETPWSPFGSIPPTTAGSRSTSIPRFRGDLARAHGHRAQRRLAARERQADQGRPGRRPAARQEERRRDRDLRAAAHGLRGRRHALPAHGGQPGSGVGAAAAVPRSKLHAKLGDDPNSVVIDCGAGSAA